MDRFKGNLPKDGRMRWPVGCPILPRGFGLGIVEVVLDSGVWGTV